MKSYKVMKIIYSQEADKEREKSREVLINYIENGYEIVYEAHCFIWLRKKITLFDRLRMTIKKTSGYCFIGNSKWIVSQMELRGLSLNG